MNFQSLLGFIIASKILTDFGKLTFNPFWDLSREIKVVADVTEQAFNPFWDLSLVLRNLPLNLEVIFQSLLGFIFMTYILCVLHLKLSIPFGIYLKVLYLLSLTR